MTIRTGGPAADTPRPAPNLAGSRASRWRRIGPWAPIVGLVLIAAMVLVGTVLAGHGAAHTGELAVDVELSQHRTLLGIVLGESISTLLGPIVCPPLVLAACVVLWQRRARRLAVLFGALVASGWLASSVVKLIVRRERPPTDVVNAVLIQTGHDSFPSGHTALTTALFAAIVVLAWMLGRPKAQLIWISVGGVLAVALVGASRMYLGVHYYGDVLAAPLVAIGGVLIAAYFLPRLLVPLERRWPLRRWPLDSERGATTAAWHPMSRR